MGDVEQYQKIGKICRESQRAGDSPTREKENRKIEPSKRAQLPLAGYGQARIQWKQRIIAEVYQLRTNPASVILRAL